MLRETNTTVKRSKARKFGQRSTIPLPLSMLPRTITAKWWTGLNTVTGCSHFGIASTGLRAPDKEESGGLIKKAVSCACCADLLNVRSEEHTSELQSLRHLVCRLLLE